MNASACRMPGRAAARCVGLELLEARTGEEREVGRDQRQDARRDEGDEARQKGGRDVEWASSTSSRFEKAARLPNTAYAADEALVHLSANIDPVAFRLGPLAVHWYGLSYLFGFICVFLWMNRRPDGAGSG